MVNPNISKSHSPSNQNTKAPAEADASTKPVADTAPPVIAEPVATEPEAVTQVPAVHSASNTAKVDTRTILSLSVSEKFARNCRMLSKLTGKSMSAVILTIAEPEIRAQLKVALASLREDVDE